MDLVKLLSREESIAGIEIRDTHVRVALFRIQKESENLFDLDFFGEEPLEKGVIVEGVIVNQPALVQAIRSVTKRSKRKIRYAVTSLPAIIAFTKSFAFPQNISKEKQEEGMRIASEFQLPLSHDQIYVDWESFDGIRNNTVEQLLVAGNKKVIDSYNATLLQIGIHSIAIETHPLSIARIIPKSESPELFAIQETTTTTIMIVQNSAIRFIRTLPKIFFDAGGTIKDEIEHICDFFESEYGVRPITKELKTIRLGDRFSNTAKELISGDMCAVAGAGLRGALPRNTDTSISLIPVGTEEAYELEKARAFTAFITNISIAVIIFFVVAYIGAWSIMVQIQRNTTNRFVTANTLPIPDDAVQFETRTVRLNSYLDVSDAILNVSPKWSAILKAITTIIPQGVSINSATFSSYNGQFVINGIAASRPILNSLRSSIESSPYFTAVNLPLSNLDKANDIPFSVNFSLKNPSEMLLSHYAE